MNLSRLSRSLAILVLSALAVAVVTPAFSAAPLTKAKVKKIARKVASKLDQGVLAQAQAMDQQILALAETRVAGAVDDDNTFYSSSSFGSIHSVDITAPRNGFLVIVGSVGMEDDCSTPGAAALTVRLRLDATPVVDGGTDDYTISGADCVGYPNEYGDSTGLDATVPVTAGAHTVHIDAAAEFGTSFIGARSLSVMFFPQGSGQTIPARTEPQGGANRG